MTQNLVNKGNFTLGIPKGRLRPYAKRITCNERMYPRSYRNALDPDEDDKLVHLARGCNNVEKGNIKQTLSDALCKLFQLQAVPEIEMEQFDGNPLNYYYFMTLFAEVVGKKIEEPRGILTRLIKFKTVEARELIKQSIQLPHTKDYQHAKALLERTYGNPHKILPSYWKEMKEWSLLKLEDTKGFPRIYNFLLKCKCIWKSQDWNAKDTSEMLCMLISELSGGLMDKWNMTVQAIRRKQISETRSSRPNSVWRRRINSNEWSVIPLRISSWI